MKQAQLCQALTQYSSWATVATDKLEFLQQMALQQEWIRAREEQRTGGDFEAAQRLAMVQSCHTTLQTVAEVSVIPNYNLRYAKRSTQNIKEDKRWYFQEAFLFSPCFQENITGNVQLKTVMFEWWLKSRGAPHSQTLIWLGKSLEKKLWNDICSPAITFENVITMIQNSIITPFAFIFLYSFII